MSTRIDAFLPSQIKEEGENKLQWAWRWALTCFVLAGATGVLFRYAISFGWDGLSLVNVRHAHSHLMYFGWVTPALMALIGLHLPRWTGKPAGKALRNLLIAAFAAALVAYPPFLLFGYTPVQIGSARMPVSVIGASLNIFAWYGFVWYYFRTTRGVERSRAMRFWDLGLFFLVLSTLGAWALPLLKPLGIESIAWSVALTHWFLDLFSEGWFVLAVLGLLFVPSDAPAKADWPVYLIVLGLPMAFAMGIPSSLVPPGLKLMAGFGGASVAIGVLALIAMAWRSSPRWRLPLALLAVKAFMQLGVCVLPEAWWSTLPNLRILYLHLMLLGFVTLGLVTAAGEAWGTTRRERWMHLAVVVVLASLFPLTSLWPGSLRGMWIFYFATGAATLPVLAALGLLLKRLNP